MDAIPNLYLKWRAVREIVGLHQSDAEIAQKIFGENDGAVKFSKLLRGDYGCTPEIATEVIAVINRRLETYRRAQGLESRADKTLSAIDIDLPVYEFTRRLVAAAGDKIEPDALERAHRMLLEEIALRIVPATDTSARLRIERYSTDRTFAPFVPAGGEDPTVFKAGLHLGGLVIEGLQRDPVAAYVLVTRDPAPQHLWEMKFGETVQWLPSPFVPVHSDSGHVLMDPQPVRPTPGRFLVTAVMILDDTVMGRLDPRGTKPPIGPLNEIETTRFLTNVRRLSKRTPAAIAVANNEYRVVA